MLALGHAMAQALGGRYGLPHGAMNALTLPPALRFNADVAPDALRRFGEALGTDDPAARVEELARLGGFRRAPRLRHPRGRAARGRQCDGPAAGREGEPAEGDGGRGRDPAALDLLNNDS